VDEEESLLEHVLREGRVAEVAREIAAESTGVPAIQLGEVLGPLIVAVAGEQ
jgi:hypothetical protein